MNFVSVLLLVRGSFNGVNNYARYIAGESTAAFLSPLARPLFILTGVLAMTASAPHLNLS